jgi:hypothetical protein
MDEASRATNSPTPVLGWLKTACDPGNSRILRCDAIERLAESGIRLARAHVMSLIGDPDPTVARYALGLVGHAWSEEDLISCAESCGHAADPLFVEEFELLKQMFVDGASDRARMTRTHVP